MTNLNFNNTTTSANTSTSEKLKEKFSHWVSNVNAMDSDYFAVTPHEGKMYYLTGNYTSEVVSFCLLIDKGSGLEAKYIYNNDTANIAPLTLIVKKDEKLLLEDNNELLGFGIKDTVSEAKTLILHFKMPHGHVFIYASENAPSVYVTHSYILDTNNDPTEDCVNAILASIKSTGKEVS